MLPTNGESLQIGVEDVAAAERASFSPHPKLLGATPAEMLAVELTFVEAGGVAPKTAMRIARRSSTVTTCKATVGRAPWASRQSTHTTIR
jgi:hypothetical protein